MKGAVFMKKIIVFFLCVMIACLVYDMAFAQEETIYYSENFESGGFNTNSNAGTPYWTLDATTGGTVSVGKDPKNILNKCLILNKTTPNDGTKVEISLHTGNVNPTSAQPYVVVEGRIMFSAISGRANLFFMYGGATSAGRLMTSAMYNKYVFTGGDTNKKNYT